MPKTPFVFLPLICALSLLMSGCATTGLTPDNLNSYVTSHQKLLTTATQTVSSFAIGLTAKDPVARASLKADINSIVDKVARGMDAAASTTNGTLTPEEMAADLKVSNPDIQAFMDAVSVLYQDGYQKMAASGRAKEALPWAKLILNSLKVLADGLNKATQ